MPTTTQVMGIRDQASGAFIHLARLGEGGNFQPGLSYFSHWFMNNCGGCSHAILIRFPLRDQMYEKESTENCLIYIESNISNVNKWMLSTLKGQTSKPSIRLKLMFKNYEICWNNNTNSPPQLYCSSLIHYSVEEVLCGSFVRDCDACSWVEHSL